MSNLTISAPSTGPKVIQAEDFYQHASILHPLIVGTIILAVVFVYLRIASNRSVAPMTLFDSLVSVAMGSTLAGVINGTALVRGLIALIVLMFWQFGTSYLCAHFPHRIGPLLSPKPLPLAFRGRMLTKAMMAHRVSQTDLYGALRTHGIWHLCEVELVVIEPNGQFSVYLRRDYPTEYEPELLWSIDGYKALREHEDECKGKSGDSRNCGSDLCHHPTDAKGKDADEIALEAS